MKLSEHDIQRQIMDLLSIQRIFFYRNNSGAMKGTHKGKSWYVKFGVKGAPDLVAVYHGTYFGIEVKRHGNDLTQSQHDFGVGLMLAGGAYIVAHSVEEFVKEFNKAKEIHQ